MEPHQRPSGTADRATSIIETLAIVALSVYGIAGGRTWERHPQPATFACCSGQSTQKAAGNSPREFTFRLSGIPFPFELSAVLGESKPIVVTISSEPDHKKALGLARKE